MGKGRKEFHFKLLGDSPLLRSDLTAIDSCSNREKVSPILEIYLFRTSLFSNSVSSGLSPERNVYCLESWWLNPLTIHLADSSSHKLFKSPSKHREIPWCVSEEVDFFKKFLSVELPLTLLAEY